MWRSVLLVMLAAASGCATGKGAPPPRLDKGVAVATAAVYMGQWRGTTSQGLAIGFTIDAGGVTTMDLAWNLASCNWASTVAFQEPATIEHGELITEIALGPGRVTTNIAITFSSDASAAGTLKFAATGVPDAPACMGVGTATFAVLKT